ncbi:MAG: phosphate ABC transporter substrate-binding protein PstS [Oscillatoriales cyanobacterium RM2_1_1]|nr:phosphate ABC transporter substrate-binding protein PstS [Oscillatoriales cyanobacterium RM2_1_1]
MTLSVQINSTLISSKITKVLTSALAVMLVACGSDAFSDKNADEVRLVLAQPVNVVGAGASFPAPLYQRWVQEVSRKTPNLQMDYQSVGSGAGIERLTQQLVDYSASDIAMTDEQIKQVQRGVVLLPMTAGSIVLAYNIQGIENLRLSRQVYADIFLGKITNWNDPAIAKDNPDIKLPNLPIVVVYRSDGSGTTGVFTKHMSAISEEWKNRIGQGVSVSWPVGLGGARNDGVAAQIRQSPGAIGFLEYGFSRSAGLSAATLENKAGNFVEPTGESATSALEAVALPDDLRVFIEDPEGEQSYPIVTYTWLLAYKNYPNPLTAKSIEAFVEFGLNQGQDISTELNYIRLPQNVRERVAEVADQISPDFDIKLD